MGRPILFNQIRPGLNKDSFRMYKFRTMIQDNNLDDESRITKVGGTLRKLSLDELPQLFNVFLGDMSLIGPRPLLEEYNDYYSDFENKRFLVKPGISGLAQVKGRNQLSWDQKLKYDVEYAEKVNFFLDLKIFFLTIYVVLTSRGFKRSGETINLIQSRKGSLNNIKKE
tara:strand:+ start:75 stop:581 length:507 start_codon:yes stop_codon:yes gene_type:complete